jgi:hypothetical protein
MLYTNMMVNYSTFPMSLESPAFPILFQEY